MLVEKKKCLLLLLLMGVQSCSQCNSSSEKVVVMLVWLRIYTPARQCNTRTANLTPVLQVLADSMFDRPSLFNEHGKTSLICQFKPHFFKLYTYTFIAPGLRAVVLTLKWSNTITESGVRVEFGKTFMYYLSSVGRTVVHIYAQTLVSSPV